MLNDELVKYVFEGRAHDLSRQFGGWLKESRRYKTFAETYKDKIRKKQRIADDDEKRLDLTLELEMAYWLLQDSRFSLEYEKGSQQGGRTPDFTVAFRVNQIFSVEVTRVRASQPDDPKPNHNTKLINAVCDKVGQMTPGMMNVLAIRAENGGDLAAAMVELRGMAEHKDELFFTRKGFKDAADFLRQFRLMSAIWQPGSLWRNSLAKYALPSELATALGRLGEG
jgi:hypothetical protein